MAQSLGEKRTLLGPIEKGKSLKAFSVTPRPGEVDTWQSPHALEWVSVSQAPSKDSQGL